MTWAPDTKAIIAILVILCAVGIVAVLLLHPLMVADNPTMFGMLNMVLGGWIAYGNTVIQYYFGSSQGSANKDDTISKFAAATLNQGH